MTPRPPARLANAPKVAASTSVSQTPEVWVCARCLDDPILHGIAASSAAKHQCLGCGRVRKGMSLNQLADRVDSMLGAYYHRAPDSPEGMDYFAFRDTGYWEPPGKSLADILTRELRTKREIAVAVCDRLAEREGGHRFIAKGGEPAYDPEQHYVLSGLFPDIARHQAFWAFENRLRYQARLFHPESRAVLQSIFQNVEQFVTGEGEPVVVDVAPGTPNSILFRARVFQSDKALKHALESPHRELGPPPAAVARAGRMNAAHVSVFYGATSVQTALAEVRPPAYARALLGRFDLTRTVRLLDVATLTRVLVEGSKFDPAHQALGRHALLLKTVSARISQPVLPDHQDESYLVTQAIADFLAYECEPTFDGMIYPSTQSIDGGSNVVLFHPASRVEPWSALPGVYIEASLEVEAEEGREPSYTVWESANDSRARYSPPGEDLEDAPDRRPTTLRLVLERLEVHHALPVECKTAAFAVDRHQTDSSQPLDF